MKQSLPYAFYFLGGTCGSFVKRIFFHYYKNTNFSDTNTTTGDAHSSNDNFAPHYHNWEDVPKERKIICIKFDNDDIDLICEMQYHKFAKEWLTTNWEEAQDQYDELQIYSSVEEMPKHVWINLYKPTVKDWVAKQDWDSFDLVIDYKTILGFNKVDLNNCIASYFNKKPTQEAQNHIDEYRKINQKIYNITREKFKIINGPDYAYNNSGPYIDSDIVLVRDHFPDYPVEYEEGREFNYNRLKQNMLLENCINPDDTIWIYDSYLNVDSTKNNIYIPYLHFNPDFYNPLPIKHSRKYKFISLKNKARFHRIITSAWINKNFENSDYFYTACFNVDEDGIGAHLHFIDHLGPGLPTKEIGSRHVIPNGVGFRDDFYEYGIDSVFSIVTEPAFWEDASHLSEKTEWAILSYNIPIVSGYGFAHYMEQAGFDMFTDIVNYSSQWEKDPWIRSSRLLDDNLDLLNNAHDILNKEVLVRLQENYNLLTKSNITKQMIHKLNSPEMIAKLEEIMYNINFMQENYGHFIK